MARIPQDKVGTIARATRYVTDKFRDMNEKFAEENEADARFKTTYLSGLDADGKTDGADAVKMLRWLLGNLSVTIPAAYTDAEVDAINPDIRTKDDGT